MNLVPENINEAIKHLKPRSKAELQIAQRKRAKERADFFKTFRSKLNKLFTAAGQFMTFEQGQEYINDEMQEVEWKESWNDEDEFDF